MYGNIAKNARVSNKVYEEMKEIKGKDRSFSEVISEALKKSREQEKTAGNLLKFSSTLKGNKEYDETLKWSRKMWEKTDERIWRNLH